MTPEVIIAIIGAVFGGGLAGSIAVLYKMKSEVNKTEADTDVVVVSAAAGAVNIQKDLILQLHAELARISKQNIEQDKHMEEMEEQLRQLEEAAREGARDREDLQRQITILREELDQVTGERDALLSHFKK